jgi:hypothetical protein
MFYEPSVLLRERVDHRQVVGVPHLSREKRSGNEQRQRIAERGVGPEGI